MTTSLTKRHTIGERLQASPIPANLYPSLIPSPGKNALNGVNLLTTNDWRCTIKMHADMGDPMSTNPPPQPWNWLTI